jgi:hypothetical protein
MKARPVISLLCAVAALIAIVGAIGVSGPSGATLDPVARAAETTSQAGGAQMSLTGSVSVPNSTTPLTFTGEGHFNFSADEGQLTLTMGGFPASTQALLHGDSLTMTELFKAASLYMSSPLFAGKLPGGAHWMKLDLARVGQAMGLDPSSLTSGGANPAQYLAYLRAGGGTVSIVGHESVRGVATTHYAGTLDLLKAAEAQPGTNRTQARAAFGKLVAETGQRTLPVQVWVDSHDLVRRISMSLDASSNGRRAQTKVQAEYFGFGNTPTVDAPSGAEVFDITQQSLLGLTGGA